MRKVMDDRQWDRAQWWNEIDRAESFLKRDTSHARILSLGLVALIVLAFTQSAGATDSKATQPPQPSTPDCSTQLKSLKFAGTFNLRNKTGAPSLRFVVGKPAGAKQAVAQIWSGNRCQASCSWIDFQNDSADTQPISLDLQCRGNAVGALTAHVALLWDQGNSDSTVLRFGSWVEGYEQAVVKVEFDSFNPPASPSAPSDPEERLVASRGEANMPPILIH